MPRIDPVFTLSGTLAELSGSFQENLQKHDYPNVGNLVVVVGGPDRDGNGFPQDEIILRRVVDAGTLSFDEIQYVESIFVHYWSNGRIERLYPNYQVIVDQIGNHHRRMTHVVYDGDGQHLLCVETSRIILEFENA